MSVRLMDGKFSVGFEAITKLVKVGDFDDKLTAAICKEDNAEAAVAAMRCVLLGGVHPAFLGQLETHLSADDKARLAANPALAQYMIAALRIPEDGHPYRGGAQPQPAEAVEYFTPLTDADVPVEHQVKLTKYRQLAVEYEVAKSVPLCYNRHHGFTLKRHVPQAGPCWKNFQYLQDWSFKDKPTTDGLVFWVPRLVKDSTSKTVDEQRQLLSEFRQRLELPEHHLSGFGEISLVAGLILAHYKATGERVPLKNLWVRTDTCRADGDRLNLGGFDGSGLRCDYWYWGARRDGRLGVFALGVELGS